MPIKDDAMHKFYNSHDRKELAKEQSVKLRHRDIVMEDNRFPYWLPRDVQQRVIWVKDGVSNRRVVEFIINVIQSEKLSNFISFERPNDSKIALIRGTIPQIRHLHFWTQIK